MNKIIIGQNIDAIIFALFNPDYTIVEHRDFKSPLFGDSEVARKIMDAVIFLFDNPYNEILLKKLGLRPPRRMVQVAYRESLFGEVMEPDPKRVLDKKLRDFVTGQKLIPETLTYANKKIQISKKDPADLISVFDIPITKLYAALIRAYKKMPAEDINGYGPVKEITENSIIFGDTTYHFDKAITTIHHDIMKKFIPGSFQDTKSLLSTLFLFETVGNYSPKIDYIMDEDIPYNRINFYKNYAVADVTGFCDRGKIEDEFRQVGYLYSGQLTLPDGKIINQFYHNLPATIEPLGRFASTNPEHRIEDTVKRAIDPYGFYPLWQDQKAINSIFQDFPVNIKSKQEQTKTFILHMIAQSTSLLDKINWRMGTPTQPLEYSEIIEDWVGMFRYWLSIGLVWEINPADFLSKCEAEAKEIIERGGL